MEIEETKKIEKLKFEFEKNHDKNPDFKENGYDGINENNRNINKDQRYNNEDNVNNYTDNNNDNNRDNKASKQKIYEDCIIEIPDIELSKIVYSGIDREKKLDDYDLITAASDMKFSNGGNYIICGHASRLYGHSLNRIREVHKDTLIRIWANNKVEDFKVNKVYYENMNDTNKYCRQTNNNEITIISCAKYISKESYIIIKASPK
ncbi:MAG: sortase [Lachnospiraceae bacterium]|nr:sortase [Lachnospiraceae bacterium]